MENHYFRVFYFNHFLHLFNKNEIPAANLYLLQKNVALQEKFYIESQFTIEQMDKDRPEFLKKIKQYDPLQDKTFMLTMIKSHPMPVFNSKKKDHANFFELLKDIITTDNIWFPLLLKYNKAFSELKSKENKNDVS